MNKYTLNEPHWTKHRVDFSSSIFTTWLLIKSYDNIEYASKAQKGNLLLGLRCEFVLHMIIFPIRIELRSFLQIPGENREWITPNNVIPILPDIPISFDLHY